MRNRTEIDSEYSIIARVYGDRVFKASVLSDEIKALHNKMQLLAQESAAPVTQDETKVLQPVPQQKKNEQAPTQDCGFNGA